jgi:two-component system nitrogen regulation response regulator GlnG
MPKILVVDDDRAIRHIVNEVFASDGADYEVLGAPEVEQGLSLIRSHAPDVVLLDIELPEISGLEAYSKIKALDNKLPVVYITGAGTSDTAIEATKLGALDYLLKPLNTAQLRETVAKAIETRRLMTVPVELGRTISPEDFGEQIIGRTVRRCKRCLRRSAASRHRM